MLLPILYAVARANSEHEFTLLTQPNLANLLLSPPNNLEAMVIDTKGEERHVWGLMRYGERLWREGFDMYLDLHDVLRTTFFRAVLRLGGAKCISLKKPREARRRLLRPEGCKDLSPIVPMTELYGAVFREAGLRFEGEIAPLDVARIQPSSHLPKDYPEAFASEPILGLAPFASTESKTYDLEQMEEVVRMLSERGQRVYLFGGGRKECEVLDAWASRYPRVRSLAGKLDLADELALLSRLSLMVSMDSANMHLASLVGRPVLSVWCATHPSAGFLGLGQNLDMCLQDEELGCRPCSIFGRVKSCIKGDMPCRRSIRPELIVERALAHLAKATD